MAIKPKATETQPMAKPAEAQQNVRTIKPEINERLNQFIEANPQLAERDQRLVREDPEWAARTLTLHRMFRHEDQMRLVERRKPMVEEWVKETPGMMERIMQRVQKVNPFYREKAFVNEAMRQHSRMHFAPNKPGMRNSP